MPKSSRPAWLVVKAPDEHKLNHVKGILGELNLHTVCEEALCPNIGECWENKTVTFMILGDVCTRNCQFCAVGKGKPSPLDPFEPENLAKAARELGLKHVVITSVDRDDLEDDGSGHFAATIIAIRKSSPSTSIEVLVPDFIGSPHAIDTVVKAGPDVVNHNMESVPRMHWKVKPKSDYKVSLNLLERSKELNPDIYTKSGIMVGLGESVDEVYSLMKDLRNVNCDILTIGQYLRPSQKHMPVLEYVTPEQFREYRRVGESMGFMFVASGPFIRSSYNAAELYDRIRQMKEFPTNRLSMIR